MAQGDVVLFQEFLDLLGKEGHNLDTDTIKLALIKSAANGGDDPAATDAIPAWGAGGTTNFDTAEVTAGGGYTAEGTDISSTWAEAAGVGTFDGSNITWTQNASSPTNARWGILYNDTNAIKGCIAYVDLGSDFDMTTGDLVVNWNASGIFTITIT